MTDIEQQARKEAEEKYPSAYSGSVMLSQRAIHRIEEFEERNDIRREACGKLHYSTCYTLARLIKR